MMSKKSPQLRFEGFTDDWEQRKFQWLIDQNIIDSPIDGNHGEKHPKSSDYVESGIPFLMAKDIKNNKIDIKNCTFISKETAEALDKGFAKNGDILLTHKATIGEVG
ncbi:TPA: restriction endonuclease subunit S, partial [Streptococcus agalactiae]